ncbi:MAG: PilZ domain-containing protein [Deltaproteobacteria bacterium]|nr:PilZ domain-containing protein [Deltaproteobacteria bacterium]
MIERAPRKKKRLSCEIVSNESRFSGIAIDISATGLFIQTNVKPTPGTLIEVGISLPGVDEPVRMEARVARKKIVPPELLTLAHGGIGLALVQPAEAYLDFVAAMSPEHAEAVANIRAKAGSVGGGGGTGEGARPRSGANAATAARLFRIHAVETTSGKRNSFLVSCVTEQEASDEVSKQLGDEWQVLFIERA